MKTKVLALLSVSPDPGCLCVCVVCSHYIYNIYNTVTSIYNEVYLLTTYSIFCLLIPKFYGNAFLCVIKLKLQRHENI